MLYVQGENVFVGLTTTDLLTGIDKKIVGQCSLDNLESFRQLFTFSLEVTSIDASENYVVAGGSDFTVKKVNLNRNGPYDRVETNGEVLCVAIDPKEEVYAVACSDGTVSVFDIKSNEKRLMNSRHTLTWSVDGAHLYVPSQGCVKVIERDGWIISYNSLKAEGTASDVFSTSCLSRCGRYLCSSTLSNKILVWNLEDESVLAQYEYRRKEKATISCMKFIPFSEKDIVLVDIDEGLCILRDAIPSMRTEDAYKTHGTLENGCSSKNEKDDDVSRSPKTHFFDDEDDGDTRMSVDIGAIKKKYGFGDDGYGDLVDSHEFAISSKIRCAPAVPTAHVAPYRPPRIPSFFVSGASPSHLSERYLKWNHYGVVRTYSSESGSSIEVSFHDVSIHPTIVLDNGITEYVLADLSDQAIALASKKEERDEESELLVIHISSWDSESRRWNTKLSPEESALDVLVSREMICLITDKRRLRVFSLTGIQRHIVSHPSPMITATCFGTQVAICSVFGGDYYEKVDQLQPSYQYVVNIYDMDGKQWYRRSDSVKSIHLPVENQGNVLWLGYTNHGRLVAMDSSYTINLLTPSGFWLPIFDGGSEITSKSDAIWPIAVIEGGQCQIRYLSCKGSKYPLVAVKMTPHIAHWRLPYCAPELTSNHLKSLIKLFALACKSERDARAAELSGLVTSAKGILMMCNYAAKLKKSTLADKVASYGRENIPLSELTSSNGCSTLEKEPTPRPLLIKRKLDVLQPRSISMEEGTLDVSESASDFNDESYDIQSQESSVDQQVNETLSCESVVPIRRYNRNPFKRSEPSTDTPSFFDINTTTTNKKRAREEETPRSSTSKQLKLQFESVTNKNEENASTAYSLWMESNEESLRDIFSGNPEDFMKFCTQQFRMLSAKDKKMRDMVDYDRIQNL
uniref:Mcl1_mid domain-containing protein n=1 Tax=Angiostrongylus cantonensis TaxID=6313 RepID=A0A0K0DGU8_ANGCA